MTDHSGYRYVSVLAPGAEQLPDILTRPVESLVTERLKTYMLPGFWLNYGNRYGEQLKERRLNPDPLVVIGAFALNVWLALTINNRPLLISLVAIQSLVPIWRVMQYVRHRNEESAYARLKQDMRWYAHYLLPVVSLWYGGMEALAVLIRWHRLKKPLGRAEIRRRIFDEGRAVTVDGLKRRLRVATGIEDEKNPLALTAESAIRAYERSFDAYRRLCETSDTDPVWARDMLRREYAIAQQAVASAEHGPTLVSVPPVVSPAHEPDYSDAAFADTLVPGRHHVTRRPPP